MTAPERVRSPAVPAAATTLASTAASTARPAPSRGMRNPARQVRRSTPSLRLARGDIWLVRPARPSRSGHPVIPDAVQSSVEATPCVVLSPNELNDHLRTVIVAPVRSASIDAPFRAPFRFRFEDRDTRASIALDQLRTVDRQRLVKRVGRLSSTALNTALSALQTMFAP